jgi:hypothetical protein
LNLHDKLNRYTGLSYETRTKSLRWLARQNEELQLVAFEKQKDFLFGLSRQQEENRSILYLASYIMAADALHRVLVRKDRKNKAIELHEIPDATRIQVKQFKQAQRAEKFEKLLNLRGKIVKLIEEEKLSYREVSRFLQTYHRLEVSHSYIATFYHKHKEEK